MDSGHIPFHSSELSPVLLHCSKILLLKTNHDSGSLWTFFFFFVYFWLEVYGAKTWKAVIKWKKHAQKFWEQSIKKNTENNLGRWSIKHWTSGVSLHEWHKPWGKKTNKIEMEKDSLFAVWGTEQNVQGPSCMEKKIAGQIHSQYENKSFR